MPEVQGGNAFAGRAGAFGGLANRAAGRTPADQQQRALGRPQHLRGWQRGGQRLQLPAPPGGHGAVQLRRAGRVPVFVMLQPAGDGITAAQDRRAGHHPAGCARDGRQVIGLVIGHGREVGRDVLAQALQVRLGKGFDAGGDGLVAQHEHRHVVLAGEVDGFNGGVEAVFDISRGQHHARGVPVAAKAGEVQIRLLDLRRQAGGRAAPLDVDHHQRHLGHDRPAQRFHLQRKPRPARAGHGDPPGIAGAVGHGNGGQLVFALHKGAAVVGQLAAQDFHHVRPRRDRVRGAEADAGGD